MILWSTILNSFWESLRIKTQLFSLQFVARKIYKSKDKYNRREILTMRINNIMEIE